MVRRVALTSVHRATLTKPELGQLEKDEMGYMRLHAIVVTGGQWGDTPIEAVHQKACEMFSGEGRTLVSELMPEAINGYRSFFIAPDGSKEGWTDSDIWDERRQRFIEWLKSKRYEDGSGPCSWVLVQFGDDDMVTRIVDDSDKDARREYRKEKSST